VDGDLVEQLAVAPLRAAAHLVQAHVLPQHVDVNLTNGRGTFRGCNPALIAKQIRKFWRKKALVSLCKLRQFPQHC